MGASRGCAPGGPKSNPGTRLGVMLTVSLMLVACDAVLDEERDLLLDERTVELAERVGEQARDEHVDEVRTHWHEALEEAADEEQSVAALSDAGAGSGLVVDITPPEGVEAVEVNQDRMRIGSWDDDDGRRGVVSRSVVVNPLEGEPFCAVVAVADDGEFRGLPARGDLSDQCGDATIRDTGEYDPMIPGWGQTDW